MHFCTQEVNIKEKRDREEDRSISGRDKTDVRGNISYSAVRNTISSCLRI